MITRREHLMLGFAGLTAHNSKHRLKAIETVPSQPDLRVSFNAEANMIEVPSGVGTATSDSTPLVRTACPRLVAGESGAARPHRNASLLIVEGSFQVLDVSAPVPTEVIAQINLRDTKSGRYITNIGFWGIVLDGHDDLQALRNYSYKWTYVPFNNIPTAPFVEVGTGAGYDVSMDLWQTGSGKPLLCINATIEGRAGNFYTPGTSKIGNSPSPGPIGTP